MNRKETTIVAGIAGLALGWSVPTVFNRNPSLAGIPTEAAEVGKRGERKKVSAGSPRLPDVDACRDLWRISNQQDDRHPLLRRMDQSRALRRWIELDPNGALAEAERNPSADFAGQLFLEWISLDPAAALDALNGAGRPLSFAVADDFFITLMSKDPGMATESLKSPRWQNETFLSWDFKADVGREWMLADPAAAIASLGGSPPENLAEGERGILEAWAEMDFKAAWAHCFPDSSTEEAFKSQHAGELLARGLLAGSPEALKVFESLSWIVFDKHEGIADQMVRANPREALAWAASRPADDLLRMGIFGRAADSISSSDPEQALALLAQSGDSTPDWKEAGTLRQIFAALSASDPSATTARIRSLPQKQRDPAMCGYLTDVFIRDPAAAVGQCRSWLDDPDLRNELPKAWAKAFSWTHGAGMRDPAGMLAAIPELNDAVDDGVLSTWAKVNPEAAATWISERLEQEKKVPVRNSGIFAELAISKPEFTAAWLETLPDETIRKTGAETLAANWAAFDPVAARRWIDGLPMGELRDAAEKGLKPQDRSTADPFDSQ